jgi:glycosyltransferase involved in cell wall biosynthesis
MAIQPLVSILTPVYNGESYLEECIESVLNQTYENWEYLIVNNCSTDRSLEIAGRYADKVPKIRIHNNDHHLGMLQNWNQALERISPDSKYCKMVLADDWIYPECLAKMVACAEANPSVGIVSSYRLEEDKVTNDGLPYSISFALGKEACHARLLGGNYFFGSPTSILIRSDLIRSQRPFYNEKNFHADNEACFALLGKSDFGFVHQVLSFTRRGNESNTTLARRLNTFLLGDIMILQKYGPVYLDPQEYNRMLKWWMKVYYQYLGRSVFDWKGKDFWDYHRKGLNEIGCPMSLARVFGWAITVLFNHLLEKMKINQL